MITIILSYSCIMVFANATPTTTSSSSDIYRVQDGSIIHPAFNKPNQSRLTSQAALENMFTKMQLDTLAFASKMENLLHFDKRCSLDTLAACAGRNHHGCNSEFPAATCPGYQYTVGACGKGVEGGCSGILTLIHRLSCIKIRMTPFHFLLLALAFLIEKRMVFVLHFQQNNICVKQWKNRRLTGICSLLHRLRCILDQMMGEFLLALI